jgi:predicted nucleotidyltransferase
MHHRSAGRSPGKDPGAWRPLDRRLSFVRGEEREESDIAILIEFEEGRRSFDTYMDLKFFLEDLFGRNVDLVDRDTIKPGLAPYILKSVRYVPGI